MKISSWIEFWLFIHLLLLEAWGDGCKKLFPSHHPKQTEFVCVCDEHYCDKLEAVDDYKDGRVKIYESGARGKRFNVTWIGFEPLGTWTDIDTKPAWLSWFIKEKNKITLTLNSSIQYQEVVGFGGAFTDSAGINIASLPEPLQETLLRAYFTKDGSEYSCGRVPIGSNDFSPSEYSYDETVDDFELKDFKLVEEDFKYKIPYIQRAKAMSERGINLLATPWSGPAWMKSNNKQHGEGTIKHSEDRRYHQFYADYAVRFLKEYASRNITFWGMTVQNEPSLGSVPNFPFQNVWITGNEEKAYVVKELGPTLEKAGLGPDKFNLMIFDDTIVFMETFVDQVFESEEVRKYVKGVAFHKYCPDGCDPEALQRVHEKYPDEFLYSSEYTEGLYGPWGTALGDWARAENYATEIILQLNRWVVAWVDWNLATDLKGGPSWVNNLVDSQIIVNATGKAFYKQPMYYAMAHFSKFLPKGSKRINLTIEDQMFKDCVVALVRPDKAIVLIALNKEDQDMVLRVSDPDKGRFEYDLPAHSIQTYIWK